MDNAIYHVTLSENVAKILELGLIPQIGTLASACAEVENRTFFFPSVAALEDALSGWMGNELEEADALSVLLIDSFGLELKQDLDYELYSTKPIPPSRITVIVDPTLPGIAAPGFEQLAYIAMTDGDLPGQQA